VVVAAGNDGTNGNENPPVFRRLIHGVGQPTAGAPADLTLTIPTYTPLPSPRANHVRFNLWYAGADRITVTVIRPDGSQHSVPHRSQALQNHPTGGVFIDNAAQGPSPQNGDNEVLILIENFDGSGGPQAGIWTIRLSAVQRATQLPVHGWIYARSMEATGEQGFTNSHVVGSPGTARRGITVGAYVPRQCWQSAETRQRCWINQEPIGDIAYFSSVGPTRDGRLKPEIAAPGKAIASSRSEAVTVTQTLLLPGGRYQVMNGTSMAAPHVAGAVAIFLQAAANLTPEEVRQVLQVSAIRDPFTSVSYSTGDAQAVPNNTWGWGKLDVEAGVAAAGAFARVSALTVVVQPATEPAAAATARGARIPLQTLVLGAEGPEAVDVLQLGFDLSGNDPAARWVIVHDVDRDGVPDPGEPVVGAVPVSLHGDTVRVRVPIDLRIPAGGTAQLIGALEMSGEAPHGTAFQSWFIPAETRARGVTTGLPTPLRQPTQPVESPVVEGTILDPGELLALSENPVRSDRLIVTFRAPPEIAEIFTVSGRRVLSLLPRMETELRVVWDLTNDRGARIADGVYLAVFRVDGVTVREKLIVARPGN
jgi:subtilisin family serine protease